MNKYDTNMALWILLSYSVFDNAVTNLFKTLEPQTMVQELLDQTYHIPALADTIVCSSVSKTKQLEN